MTPLDCRSLLPVRERTLRAESRAWMSNQRLIVSVVTAGRPVRTTARCTAARHVAKTQFWQSGEHSWVTAALLQFTPRSAVHEPIAEDFEPRASIRGIHRAAYAQNWVPRKPLLSRRRPIERYNSEGIREALVEERVRTRRQSARPWLAASSNFLLVEFREQTTEADV
jgi:hypothetical protein